jgi:hypothetical protein
VKNLKGKLLIAVAGFVATSALAEGLDGSKPLLCSIGHAIECIDGQQCKSVTHADIDAPDFVKFDFRNKTFSSIVSGIEGEQRDLGPVTNTETHLIIQGTQGGSETARDALGWTLTVHKESGQAVVSAAGNNAGFVLFGACMPL